MTQEPSENIKEGFKTFSRIKKQNKQTDKKQRKNMERRFKMTLLHVRQQQLKKFINFRNLRRRTGVREQVKRLFSSI